MQNDIKTIILLLSIILFVSCSNKKKELNVELDKIAAELNNSAPVQLDVNTIFFGAEVTPDNIFKYKYKIINSENPSALLEKMEFQTRENIKKAFRINPNLQIFTENNVKIHYIYTDSLGEILKTIEITPEDYK